jgi:hypothetical protein
MFACEATENVYENSHQDNYDDQGNNGIHQSGAAARRINHGASSVPFSLTDVQSSN